MRGVLLSGLLLSWACTSTVVEFGQAPPAPDFFLGEATAWEAPGPGTPAARLTGRPFERQRADLFTSGVLTCADPSARERLGPFERRIASNPKNRLSWYGSGGVIAGDFDGDGHLDLVAPAEPYAKLYRGGPDGAWHEDRALLDLDVTNGIGGSTADYDADGDLDLLVLRLFEKNLLLQNQGDGSFVDVTDSAMPPEPRLNGRYGPSMASSWADFDGDGDLDLFVGNYGELNQDPASDAPGWPSQLLQNRGDGTFSDISHQLPASVHNGYTYVAGFHDLDADSWPELYVVNDLGWVFPNQLLSNVNGSLVPDQNRRGLDLPLAGGGLGVGDLNGDLVPDFLIPEWNEVKLLQSGPELWLDYASARGIVPDPNRHQQTGWGAELADIDNDGDLDALVAYGHLGLQAEPRANPTDQPDAIFLQEATGAFRDVAPPWQADDTGSNRGFVLADLNHDGWLDIAKRDLEGPSVLYLSRCSEAGWLRVQLHQPGLNRAAIGARVEVEVEGKVLVRQVVAGGTSYGSGGPAEIHFGLGAIDRVDRVTVTWPDGHRHLFEDLEARQLLLVVRGE